MAETEKQVRYDLDGYEVITNALQELINIYPGLIEGDKVAFCKLGAEEGKAMFPISGAIIETERRDILGGVTQVCLYPFYVVYRVAGLSESRKVAVKEWLDNLGRWLERQNITVGDTQYRLAEYPALTGKRSFVGIQRQTPAYLESVSDNQVEDWAIYISARYRNEF